MNYNKLYSFSIILFCLLCAFLPGCAVDKGKIYEKNGKVYGKHEGLFKGKWYNYYLRGLSYSEGGFWEDATADFMKATKKRNEDNISST